MIGDKNQAVLPKGWTSIEIGDVYTILGGGTPSTAVSDYWNGDIPWITSADIHGLKDIKPKRFITKEGIKNSVANLVPGNSLIVVTRVGLGKVAKTKTPICFSQDSQALIAKGEIVSPDYALYYLSQAVQIFKYRHRGTTIPGVTKKQLSDLKFIVPPINEQHRIVAKIEELFSDLDAGVEALKKAKAQLRLYRQAVLKAAFEGRLTVEWREAHKCKIKSLPNIINDLRQSKSLFTQQIVPSDNFLSIPSEWEWIELNKITQSMQNGIYKPKNFYSSDGIACLRMYNIENGVIVWKDIKRMVLSDQEIGTYGLKENDILINRVNSRELVGKSAVIPDGLEQCVYESKNIRLRVKESYVESKYVNYWFQLNGRRYFDKNTQQTVGMASINQEQIGAMPIPYTILSEQQEIIKEIEYSFSIADEAEKIITQSFIQSERLRQSILKQAFSGQLVPQDPQDEPAEILLARIREEKAKELPVKKLKRKATQRKLDYGQ